MTSKVFVIGATGTTGSATVRALRAAGADVVAGVRSADKAGPLTELGAVVKPVNMEDVAGMQAAMRGSDRLFLVTPASDSTVALTASIVEAAKAAGVRHVAKLSGLNVGNGPRFAFGKWHRDAEKVIEASGLDWTFLRPNAFMQNFFGNAQSVKQQGIYFSPFGSTPISFVDARDIADVAAKVLTTDGHGGKSYNLTGPKAITNEEVSRHLSTAAKKQVSCVPVTLDQLREALIGHGMPPVVAS